jgi:DNA-directed RNA polymerase specialized sigma subunit
MSCEELEIEEESVQLTREDIELLSEYSWDMTGYTSRFGYFYLGSEKENVQGLTKWQAENIYQLTPNPPGMEDALQNMEKSKRINKEKKKEILQRNEAVADQYLVRAVEEKNLLYLSFFFHGYEHKLNGKVYSFIRRNGMDPYDPALFLDMKLALQELILKKLPTFDPAKEAKFLTYLHQFIYDVFKTFRMNQESWKVKSLDIYKDIRRIAAIYNANAQDQDKTIEIFCEKTGLKPETAKRYLQEAIGIRARQTEKIIDWDENEQAIMEDVIPDDKGSLNHIVWNHWKGKVIRDAMEKLSWREQTILKARNAICSNCGGMMPKKDQYQFQEIGKRIMKGASDKGAEVAYHAALDRLAAQLIKDGSCCIVDLYLENLEQAENKNAAATYRYRVDCDGEWGEIYFDLENKKIKIQQLAEWDTTRSHKYAWKVIGFIALKGNKVLPEKKRLIFWDGDIGQKKKRVLLQDGSVIYLPLPR